MDTYLRPKVGLGVVVVKEGKILVGKRTTHNGQGTWGLPGGHLERHETWEACARREVSEEAGIEINQVRFLGVTNDAHTTDDSHYVTIFMYADYQGGEVQNLEPEKCSGWGWFRWEEIPEPRFKPLETFIQQGVHPLATYHGKLVRDRIPDIIAELGAHAYWHTADQKEYEEALKTKLLEEVQEYLERSEIEELADILEVIHSLQALSGMHREQLDLLQEKKRDERGGFQQRIILDETRG